MESHDVTDKEENAGELSSFPLHDKNHMVFPVRGNFMSLLRKMQFEKFSLRAFLLLFTALTSNKTA